MFKDCINLISISLPDMPNVTSISYMFSGCTNLQEIKRLVIPSQISSSNRTDAFTGCTSLTKLGHIEVYNFDNIPIPKTQITDIDYIKVYKSGSTTTANMTNLISVGTVESNYEYMGLFSGCTKLQSVNKIIYPNATTLSDGTYRLFENCSSLQSQPIMICPNVTDISYAFKGCSSLTEIDLSIITGSVTNMLYIAYGCTSLTNIKLPSDLSSITNISYAFYNCTKLKEIDRLSIPNFNPSSTSYYISAFRNCTSLTKLGYIDIYNFTKCPIPLTNITSIEYLKINDTATSFTSLNNKTKLINELGDD